MPFAYQNMKNQPKQPNRRPPRTTAESRVWWNPTASERPWIGKGEYASIWVYPCSREAFAASISVSGEGNSAITPYNPSIGFPRLAISASSSLFRWVICERRWAGCESPRRGDAGTSLRSGDEADGPPPPQSTQRNELDEALVLLPRVRRRLGWRDPHL